MKYPNNCFIDLAICADFGICKDFETCLPKTRALGFKDQVEKLGLWRMGTYYFHSNYFSIRLGGSPKLNAPFKNKIEAIAINI